MLRNGRKENVAVQCLAFLLFIQDTIGSNLYQMICYCEVCIVSSVLPKDSGIMRLDYDAFFTLLANRY